MRPVHLIVALLAAGTVACSQDAPKAPPKPAPKVETPKSLAQPATGVTTAASPTDATKK